MVATLDHKAEYVSGLIFEQNEKLKRELLGVLGQTEQREANHEFWNHNTNLTLRNTVGQHICEKKERIQIAMNNLCFAII